MGGIHPYFEGCMPIEVMASRGAETLRFGPMKPVGLTNAHDGSRPHAVIQLRQDNALGTLYNMVGFQTKLKYAEQVRVFQTIPGLENAQFARLGGLHRNTFINSPRLLDGQLRMKARPGLRFAGQITGVEGYVESAAIGLMAGIMAAAQATGSQWTPPPVDTAHGALLAHITGGADADTFQPMNVNFGLFRRLTAPQPAASESFGDATASLPTPRVPLSHLADGLLFLRTPEAITPAKHSPDQRRLSIAGRHGLAMALKQAKHPDPPCITDGKIIDVAVQDCHRPIRLDQRRADHPGRLCHITGTSQDHEQVAPARRSAIGSLFQPVLPQGQLRREVVSGDDAGFNVGQQSRHQRHIFVTPLFDSIAPPLQPYRGKQRFGGQANGGFGLMGEQQPVGEQVTPRRGRK